MVSKYCHWPLMKRIMFISSDGVNVPTDKLCHFKLFVFDAKGNMKHQSPLQFLKKDSFSCWSPIIAVTKDKNIVITHGIYTEDVHVCNSSGELNYSYLMDEFHAGLLRISDDWNEIFAAVEYRNFVYICTETGKNLMIR